MNIFVAPDKFRGSLEAEEVCNAVRQGILLAYPQANVTIFPLADGGEGTAQILTKQSGGVQVTTLVSDPLGRKMEASYGLSADKKVAFIEMAAASGLKLLTESERNPALTTTFGTGELIIDALNKGVRKIILGIGGSATTDGGIGVAAALGYQFFDEQNTQLAPTGESLHLIRRIDSSHVDERINHVSIDVACDVSNPLFGENGAAYIYGPQKGATPQQVEELDRGLQNLAEIASATFGKNFSEIPGAGAAGGLGAGCMWFMNATLKDGVSIVIEQGNVIELVKKADLVITGEGKIDAQTLNGKVVKGLAGYCQQYDVPLAALCGTLEITPEQSRNAGITYAVSVLNRPTDLETAQREAFGLVRDATFQLVRLFFQKSRSDIS